MRNNRDKRDTIYVIDRKVRNKRNNRNRRDKR